MSHQKTFFNSLQNLFLGVKIEGQSGFIKLRQIKFQYFQHRLRPALQQEIQSVLHGASAGNVAIFPELHEFFQRYFNETGAICINDVPPDKRLYRPLDLSDSGVAFAWRTQQLYYIKSDRLLQSIEVAADGRRIFVDASALQYKRANEKRRLSFDFKKEDAQGRLVFTASYSEGGHKDNARELASILSGQGIKISRKTLQRVFRQFAQQTEADYFINKDARGFLREQLDWWIIQRQKGAAWPKGVKTAAFRRIALCIIDLVAAFEKELARIWNKPRFALKSDYVITVDRLQNQDANLLRQVVTHSGFSAQMEEWRQLGLVKPEQKAVQLFNGSYFRKKYEHLPLDTRYFPELKNELLATFNQLDESLDGWLIKSENYQALRTLFPKFQNRIQTIYIDPPFNLGTQPNFHYNVNYKDAVWMTLLENRLSVAHDLLKDAGSLFVRCDYNGNMYMRLLLNLIFGEENFHNELLINRKRQSIGTPRKFEVESEFLYWYGKTSETYYKSLYRPRSISEFRWIGFLKQEDRNPAPRMFLGKTLLPPPGQHFSLRQEKVDKLLADHFLRLRCRQCRALYYFDEQDSGADFARQIASRPKDRFKYLDITAHTEVFGVKQLSRCLSCGSDSWLVQYLPADQKKITDNWKDIPSYEGGNGFKTQNSEILLQRVIEATSKPGDLVMDFFLGSGTATAAAHKLGRKWIGVEMGGHFEDVLLPRMKKVLAGERSGISKTVGWRGGGFFKYFELEQYEDTLQRLRYVDDVPAKENTSFMLWENLTMPGRSDEEHAKVDLTQLYETIDLAESISCLTGKMITRIAGNIVDFEDDLTVDLSHVDISLLKQLLFWQD